VTEEQAKQRFIVLSALRFVGFSMVLIGVLNIAGKFMPALGPALGYAFLFAGVVDFFAVPMILKRVWQKQDQ
jgi:hypothetical protein